MMVSDVCLSHRPKSRTERLRRTKIGTEVASVTHDSWTPLSRSKGQGHQAALLTAALTRQAAAAVSVGTYGAWEHTATLPSAGAVGSAARGASALIEGGEGRGHIVAAARLQLVCFEIFKSHPHDVHYPDVFQQLFGFTVSQSVLKLLTPAVLAELQNMLHAAWVCCCFLQTLYRVSFCKRNV